MYCSTLSATLCAFILCAFNAIPKLFMLDGDAKSDSHWKGTQWGRLIKNLQFSTAFKSHTDRQVKIVNHRPGTFCIAPW